MSLKIVWHFVKRFPAFTFFTMLTFYLIMFAITGAHTTVREGSGCDEITKILNGGVRHYDGQKYELMLCDYSGGNSRVGISGTVRLQIYDAQKVLWSERFFDAYWERPNGLEYTDTSITYFDDSKQEDFEKTISMPPSRWEWLKVRVNHAFWSVMEFVFFLPLKNWLESTFPPETSPSDVVH